MGPNAIRDTSPIRAGRSAPDALVKTTGIAKKVRARAVEWMVTPTAAEMGAAYGAGVPTSGVIARTRTGACGRKKKNPTVMRYASQAPTSSTEASAL